MARTRMRFASAAHLRVAPQGWRKLGREQMCMATQHQQRYAVRVTVQQPRHELRLHASLPMRPPVQTSSHRCHTLFCATIRQVPKNAHHCPFTTTAYSNLSSCITHNHAHERVPAVQAPDMYAVRPRVEELPLLRRVQLLHEPLLHLAHKQQARAARRDCGAAAPWRLAAGRRAAAPERTWPPTTTLAVPP